MDNCSIFILETPLFESEYQNYLEIKQMRHKHGHRRVIIYVSCSHIFHPNLLMNFQSFLSFDEKKIFFCFQVKIKLIRISNLK